MQYKLRTVSAIFMLLTSSLAMLSCSSRNDDEIQKDVNQSLSESKQSNVTAQVADGVVKLDGQCMGENCADSIAARIKDIDGVKDVENNLQQGTVETDLTLRTSVQSIISKYQGVQAEVAGGEVVLRGIIQRDQLQPLMNELGTLKAKKIDNQLAVQ